MSYNCEGCHYDYLTTREGEYVKNPGGGLYYKTRNLWAYDYEWPCVPEEVFKIAHFDIHKVIKSGNAVIVFWSLREKTIVRLKDDDTDDIYSAVAQAIAKRMYGSTNKFHKMIDKALVEQKEK